MGYMLAKKESITKIADALRRKDSKLGLLTFPDDFVLAIENMQLKPQTPTTETRTLTFSDGTYSSGDFTAVGHNTDVNYVSKWKLTPTINVSSAVFTFSWANKSSDGGPGVGYSAAITIAFTIGGKTATYTIENKADAGAISVTITGLALKAGVEYEVTARESVYGTTNNFKMFKKTGNTVKLTT